MDKEPRQRTLRQNKSLHKLCADASQLCNEHGIDMPILMQHYRINTTPESIKDIIRETGHQKFGKISTADLTTTELQACFMDFRENLIRISNGHIEINFPSFTNSDEYLESL